jgi:acetamidase/formamidase
VNGFREHKAAGVDVPAAMEAIFTAGCGVEAPGDRVPCGKIGPHLLTGPVAVAGAEVGDVLQVGFCLCPIR